MEKGTAVVVEQADVEEVHVAVHMYIVVKDVAVQSVEDVEGSLGRKCFSFKQE